MISGVSSPDVRSRVYRSGWLIVALAVISYVLVAAAEQGTVGAGLRSVPESPLPFARHHGAGLDLSQMSSLTALDWLEQADTSSVTTILLPLDGDIVEAFNAPESYADARRAVQTLVDAVDDSPIVVCLRRPVSAVPEEELAEAAVTALVDGFGDSIAYITTCGSESSSTWHGNVIDILGLEPSGSASERILAPVSVGPPIRLQRPIGLDDLSGVEIDGLAGDLHVAISLRTPGLLDEQTRMDLQDDLRTRSHLALFLVAPPENTSPAEVVQALAFPPPDSATLFEGYNSVTTPGITWQGEWIPTEVGPVLYQRSIDPGSVVTAEFVGTEVWALGIAAPEGGMIGVWIDAPEGSLSSQPDVVVDFSRTQARDDSFLLVDGLSASTHRLTIVTSEGDVAISGFFVTGRPEAGWQGFLAALGLIVLAIAGLTAVIAVAVDELRLRIGLDRSDDEEAEHPRVFKREV